MPQPAIQRKREDLHDNVIRKSNQNPLMILTWMAEERRRDEKSLTTSAAERHAHGKQKGGRIADWEEGLTNAGNRETDEASHVLQTK